MNNDERRVEFGYEFRILTHAIDIDEAGFLEKLNELGLRGWRIEGIIRLDRPRRSNHTSMKVFMSRILWQDSGKGLGKVAIPVRDEAPYTPAIDTSASFTLKDMEELIDG